MHPRPGIATTQNTQFLLAPFDPTRVIAAIHQFAHSRNNDLTNGIALSKNAHWLFDNGLWSLRDDYTVLVAERHFHEAGEPAYMLAQMKGKKITLPVNVAHWPAKEHLRWHRTNKFLGQ